MFEKSVARLVLLRSDRSKNITSSAVYQRPRLIHLPELSVGAGAGNDSSRSSGMAIGSKLSPSSSTSSKLDGGAEPGCAACGAGRSTGSAAGQASASNETPRAGAPEGLAGEALALIEGEAATYTPRTAAEAIVLGMGAQLHERYISFDSAGLFRELFHKLGADARQQVVSQDLREQLELSVEIGKGCAGIYACSSELIDGRPVEEYAPALAGYGALAECLDNAYEITQDLREGSNTYATLWIRQHGDSRDNHRQARSTLAQRGMREYNNGRGVLNPKQAGLYSLMGRIVSARYKVTRGIRGSIGPKVLLAPAYEA